MAEQLTQQRDLYVSSMLALAANMRQCAEIGEAFAKSLKNASDDEMHLLINGKRKASGAPDDEEAPKRRKRTTKPKDPNAPKRPASSYILFQNEIRKELKEKHPNLTNPELLNMISDLWKKMSDHEKAQYHKAVESAKERYSQDKKAYDNRTPEEVAAANAAAAEAAALKKTKPRKKSQKNTAPPAEVLARPPPTGADTSPSASSEEEDSSAGEDSDEDPHGGKESQADSDSSEEEEEAEIPPTKRAKKASTNATHGHKGKKGSK